MMLDTQDSEEDKQNVLVAKIDNVKNVSQLLKAVHFKEVILFVVYYMYPWDIDDSHVLNRI